MPHTTFDHLHTHVNVTITANIHVRDIPLRHSLYQTVVLELDENLLRGSLPNVFTRLTNLRRIRLDENNLTGRLPPSWGALTALTLLTFHTNQFSGSLGAFDLAGLRNLLVLWGSNNELTGTVPSAVGRLTNLREWRKEVEHGWQQQLQQLRPTH